MSGSGRHAPWNPAGSAAAPAQARARVKGRSIRLTLLLILLATLLPLALLTTLQGLAKLEEERAELRGRLSDAAMLTAYSEQNSIQRARGLLTVLGSSADIVGASGPACNARLAEVRDALPAYSHFSVIGADGIIRCAANPIAVGESVRAQSFWDAITSAGGFTITPPVRGRYSGGLVIWAVQPLRAADGTFAGAITASIDLHELRKLLRTRQAASNALVAIVDGRGTPVASSLPLDWNRIPVAARPGHGGVLHGPRGNSWTYATAPLHSGSEPDNSLHIVYAARRPSLFSEGNLFLFSYFAIPIAALLVASLAIWYGTNRAILHWISRLGLIAEEVGRGEYRVPYRQFVGAPSEVRGLAAELRRMARTISRRDRTLNNALLQQSALSRELHHRVRNNLQIIASFLALRQAGIDDPAAARALAEARMHVAVVSAVHRLLYDRGELAPVQLGQLVATVLPPIARDLGREAHASVEPVAGGIAVGIDDAVAVALWLLQAAMLLADSGPVATPLEALLELRANRLHLALTCPGEAWAPRDTVTRPILEGIARQLRGTLSEHAREGRRGFVLDLPLPD